MSYKKVFLSSTAVDLAECRDAVCIAIHGLDECHCIRMEDFGARDSLPKELCVKKVKECDLFVGILGHLYGSMPEGSDKSYTEVEYETAATLAKPMFMFLADDEFQISASQVEPPDKQERQRAFRSRIDRERTRKSFSNASEVALGVVTAIRNYESELPTGSLNLTGSGTEVEWTGVEQRPELASELAITDKVGAVAANRLDSVMALRKSLSKGEPDPSRALTDVQIVRVWLLGKAMLGKRIVRETLGIHEANAIYLHREGLVIGQIEAVLVLESLFGENQGTIPGWYWYREASRDSVVKGIWQLALGGYDSSVREHAISALLVGQIPIETSPLDAASVFEELVKGRPMGEQKAFFDYLAKAGTRDFLGPLDSSLKEGELDASNAAARARWQIVVRTDPASAFLEVLQMQEPPGDAIVQISAELGNISEEGLLKGVSHAARSLRPICARELVRRKRLTTDLARALLQDESLALRKICLVLLIENGERFGADQIRSLLALPSGETARSALFSGREYADADDVVYCQFAQIKYEDLVEHIKWSSLDGPIAYRVLGERHFPQMQSRIRQDLSDNFESLWQKVVGEISGETNSIVLRAAEQAKKVPMPPAFLQELRNAVMTKLISPYEKLKPFLRERYATAALAALAKNGEGTDLPFARKRLAEKEGTYYGEVHFQAMKMIERFGSSEDVDLLLTVARDSSGETKELAAKVAIGLSPGPDGAARRLLETGDSVLFRLAVESLFGTSSPEVKDLMKSCLMSEESHKRIQSLRYLVRVCEPPEVADMLRAYTSVGNYYYNVVCWLDRLLYAPEPLRTAYRRELDETA